MFVRLAKLPFLLLGTSQMGLAYISSTLASEAAEEINAVTHLL
jgi:hypothetical protein